MAEVEIKRGYEVLPDNNIRFGIKVTNTDGLVITDVEVTLYYPESLFSLEADRHQNLGNISPASTRTAEFLLKPLGCVHEENIEAHISYRDPKGHRHSEDMQPKQVHCVCPFLKGLKVQKAEFLELSGTGHSAETGLNFEGVGVERLTSFLVQTCQSRHYKVDELSIDACAELRLGSPQPTGGALRLGRAIRLLGLWNSCKRLSNVSGATSSLHFCPTLVAEFAICTSHSSTA